MNMNMNKLYLIVFLFLFSANSFSQSFYKDLVRPVTIFYQETRVPVPSYKKSQVPYRWVVRVRGYRGGNGSGVLVSPCHVLTNHHVVKFAGYDYGDKASLLISVYLPAKNKRIKAGFLYSKTFHKLDRNIRADTILDDWAIVELEECLPISYGCAALPPKGFNPYSRENKIIPTFISYGTTQNNQNEMTETSEYCKVKEEEFKSGWFFNDCPVTQVSSGSPFFSAEGYILGLNSFEGAGIRVKANEAPNLGSKHPTLQKYTTDAANIAIYQKEFRKIVSELPGQQQCTSAAAECSDSDKYKLVEKTLVEGLTLPDSYQYSTHESRKLKRGEYKGWTEVIIKFRSRTTGGSLKLSSALSNVSPSCTGATNIELLDNF